MTIGGPNIYPGGGFYYSGSVSVPLVPGVSVPLVPRSVRRVTFNPSGLVISSTKGIAGFEDKAARPGTALTGIRWWTMDAVLRGVYAPWLPGENVAYCISGWDHQIPAPECGCGFWAYWQDPLFFGTYMWNEENFINSMGVPVCGIIEGYGRALVGPKGFRCEKAKITALLVPPHYKEQAARVQPQAMIYTDMRMMTGEHPPGWGRENPGLPE